MTKAQILMIAVVLPFVAASAAYAGPFSWFPIKPRTPVVAPEIDSGDGPHGSDPARWRTGCHPRTPRQEVRQGRLSAAGFRIFSGESRARPDFAAIYDCRRNPAGPRGGALLELRLPSP